MLETKTVPGRILCVMLIIASTVSCTVKQEALEKRPNVVFMILDDLSPYAYESKVIVTPNLDRLMKEATYFPNSNCAAPVCIPSRAALFSGVAPYQSGVYLNGGDPWNDSEVLKSVETLPELFRRSGYLSYGRGKIYHKTLEEGRIERNFDNRPIYEGGFGPFPDSANRVSASKDQFPRFWGVQSFADSLFPDIQNTDAVIDFLNQNPSEPFVVTLGLWRPHTPFTAPQRFFDQYVQDDIEVPAYYKSDDLDDVPEYGKSLLDPFGRFDKVGPSNPDLWRRFLHGYYACTSFADWNVGRIMDAIENSEHKDNTIFILITDNGFHVGAKNHWEKNTLWDASALSPMFIKLPGGKPMRVKTPVSLLDIYPTLVELCGLESPDHQLAGQSLSPILANKTEDRDPVITTFGEGLVSLRTEKFRYISYPDGTEELYDVEQDPYEWNNLISEEQYAEEVQRLREHLPVSYAEELPGRRN